MESISDEGNGVGRGGGSVPRSMTGLRSRRELGSFYMRRKENGDTVGVPPGGGGIGGGGTLSPTGNGGGGGGGGGGGFAPRRAPSFARGLGAGNAGPKSNANVIMETFAKLSVQERERLVQDLERRAGGGGGGRKNLPRPMSRSLESDGNLKSPPTSEGSSGGRKKGRNRVNGGGTTATTTTTTTAMDKFIENPVEVSSRSNLSDFSDAEEVESEDLEGESREVGEEVERWLTEGFVEQNGTTKKEGEDKEEGCVCKKCEEYAMKVLAMESAMGKMQAEMAELRVKLKKADKRSKSWVKIPGRSSKRTTPTTPTTPTTTAKTTDTTATATNITEKGGRRGGGGAGGEGDKTEGRLSTKMDPVMMAKELDRIRTKLEDTEMEREAYRQAAKMHLEALMDKQNDGQTTKQSPS